MDWITQNKFRSWLLIVLLASNLLTVSIIWMQTARTNEPRRKEQGPHASESVNLMKKALDLDEEQVKRVENTIADRREQSRKYDDRLTELKKQLAEELFKGNPDTSLANATAIEIGELQSKIEMIRFQHFRELLAICTPEQKAQFKPIVIEVFGRKPPQEEPGGGEERRGAQGEKVPRDGQGEKGPRDRQEEKGPRGKSTIETQGDNPQTMPEGKPEPPSVDEKLAKYSERLNLTDEQVGKIRAVLLKARQKGEDLRTRVHPDRNEIQTEKERLRRDEDDGIMNILNEDQKAEFSKMVSKRTK